MDVRLEAVTAADAAPRRDPWNSWVFSLRGSASANAAGLIHQSYHEVTLFGKTEEMLPRHELSVNYSHKTVGFGRRGDRMVPVPERPFQIAARGKRRGLVADCSRPVDSADANASRIRDQISLRARGASPEEILLRLRELQSDYEYGFSISLTYTFGSIFSSIVNPRFGQ